MSTWLSSCFSGGIMITLFGIGWSFSCFFMEPLGPDREQILRELDGDLIRDHSNYLVIRRKRLRVVDLPRQTETRVPLVVFLHGLGGQVSQWQEQLNHISSRCHVIALDLVGHGDSEVSERLIDYSLDSIVEDVVSLLTKFEVDYKHNLVLVAHSYGTMVAVKVRQRLPHLVCGLTLISPVRSLPKKKGWLTKLPPSWLDILRRFDRIGGSHSVSVNRAVHESASESIRLRQLKWNSTSRSVVVQNLFHHGAELDDTAYHSLSTVPLLFIGGSHDSLSPPSSLHNLHRISSTSPGEPPSSVGSSNDPNPSESLDLIRDANGPPIILEDCGHNPMVEKPDLVNDLLTDFITAHCRWYPKSGE